MNLDYCPACAEVNRLRQERDEARAEVEMLRGGLEHVSLLLGDAIGNADFNEVSAAEDFVGEVLDGVDHRIGDVKETKPEAQPPASGEGE